VNFAVQILAIGNATFVEKDVAQDEFQ